MSQDNGDNIVNGNVPVADHTMYMYHEPSGSYYEIPEGEPCYNGSSIDFEFSREVTKEEYLEGKRQEEIEEKMYMESMKLRQGEQGEQSKALHGNDGKNRLEKTLGIFDMLSD